MPTDIMSDVTVGPGWQAFLDPAQYMQYALILITATASGALLAFHPVYRGRATTFQDYELRKTLIIYSTVGALISIICSVNPSMAFVIFGIGGLMRFRTNLDSSKSTGHAIMGTLVGLCWGLGLEMVAVFATVYFWIMIFALEQITIIELVVGGVKIPKMGPSTEAYRAALNKVGVKMCSQNKNFKKVQTTYVLRIPRSVSIEQAIVEVNEIPEELRGTPDWPER